MREKEKEKGELITLRTVPAADGRVDHWTQPADSWHLLLLFLPFLSLSLSLFLALQTNPLMDSMSRTSASISGSKSDNRNTGNTRGSQCEGPHLHLQVKVFPVD